MFTLVDYKTNHPHVTMQREANNRRVDVIEEGLDLAICVRPLEDSELVVKVLSTRY